MNKPLHCQLAKPDKLLADFVDTFSSLQNLSDTDEAVVIPNGKIDLQFSKTEDNELQISLLGIETQPSPKLFPKQENLPLFAVSFNPLAAEYIFKYSIANLLNTKTELPNNFWDFNICDLNDFDFFCKKVSQKIHSLLPKEIDSRKRKLFELIFITNGEMSVKELSENVFYSTRQINAYFNQQFGLSLKAYCNIIRFQASLSHIKDGKLSPQLNYYDQSHFIKEIKKLSGASPKELLKNENSRFLQFLVPIPK
ncbi:helix-turn-helix domain-containing protein [Pedobacter arcticus]|uniref:helix-turn-helix domain-containing protein n=1 Tax=Pedobacter arcticus TaxID=752140 RepID=UPI00036F567E|nr:AraC family transcriptional regulator [Pedobacter arcticus]